MSARILDGIAAADAIAVDLRRRVRALASTGRTPVLGIVRVGEHPTSVLYATWKQRYAIKIGVRPIVIELPANSSLQRIRHTVLELNRNPHVVGVSVHLPPPESVDDTAVLELVNPAKDADGMHPQNLGRLTLQNVPTPTAPLPCTPRAVVALLNAHEITTSGRCVTVIGRRTATGRALAVFLSRQDGVSSVTLTDPDTPNLKVEVARADIVVAAAGISGLVKADWIRLGAVVVDVGLDIVSGAPRAQPARYGEVDPHVQDVAAWISMNPGGVGPMALSMLMANVVESAERFAASGS